ncbi:MAG TPA: cytochrome c biogenesis protein CcsA [Rickettsiales bacterium]|nr:cytochrome c biogenesis protein CcsA [Rickettsiales bacterium]
MKYLLTLFLLLFPLSLLSAENVDFDYGYLAHTPILHEGRIKPLDSFARVYLKKIHGAATVEGEPAIAWLAGTLFAPAGAMQQPLFNVKVPEVVQALSLPERSDRMYSFVEMAAVFGGREQYIKSLLAKDKRSLTENEQELIRLFLNTNDFAEIIGTFSLLLPFSEAPEMNYLEAMRNHEKIVAAVKATVKAKGKDLQEYTPQELLNVKISYRMDMLSALDKRNMLLRIIPPAWKGTDEWLAPWAVIEQGQGSPETGMLFKQWQKLAADYNTHDIQAWKSDSAKIEAFGAGYKTVRPFALSLEVIYNSFAPLNKSVVLYPLGAMIALLALVMGAERVRVAAYLVMAAATGIHGLAILMRMGILMRPPVSTLYESMIFVSFLVSAFGLWLEHKKGNGESLLVSGIVSSLLILAANIFAADSDTLEVLVAVLNTNFWLATHVVCITTGYASAIVAGAIAHIYLIKRAIGKTSASAMAALHRRLHMVALVALLFTTVGTMLGGIWADQSWGRFWGWDPKENGALWIVLWLIWLLHGRVAGQVREVGFAIGMALINIVVALAWVGVNLLSVGLHSYGFTDAAATGLTVFCSAEVVFILIISPVILMKSRTAHRVPI